jgi:hypothetical protein
LGKDGLKILHKIRIYLRPIADSIRKGLNFRNIFYMLMTFEFLNLCIEINDERLVVHEDFYYYFFIFIIKNGKLIKLVRDKFKITFYI